MQHPQAIPQNISHGGSILSTGALVVLVLAVVGAAIGSSSWAYKAYKSRRARKISLRQSRDGMLASFLDDVASGSGGGVGCGGQYGSSAKSKHLASPIAEDDQTYALWQGKLGGLEFSAGYDSQKQVLSVSVLRCLDLPSKDPQMGTSDPYVKLQLLPEKKLRVKTQIQRKTLNPVFGETFTFVEFTLNQVKATSLHFVVLSFDRFSRDDIIGEVVCPLSELDLNMAPEVTVTRDIQPRRYKARPDDRGEVLLSICHQPAANVLTVVILKARNLPKTDATGLAGDPYIKLYMLLNGQRICKKKTHVKKRTHNPVYNQSFSFDLHDSSGHDNGSLDSVALELLVMDYDRVSKNEVIGRLLIGSDCGSEKAQQHWQEVVDNPRKQTAEWHKLCESG